MSKKKIDRAEREKRVKSSIATMEKKFGKGIVVRFDRKAADEKLAGYSFGVLGLDAATGCGGAPKGRITEIFGPYSSGKSSVALKAIVSAQAEGDDAAYIDVEQCFDPTYARRLGVNTSPDRLVVSQPDYGEQALEVVQMLLEAKVVSIIVVDSVANLIPRGDMEGEIGDHMVGAKARMLTQGLNKQLAIVRRNGVAVIYLNQMRAVIGGMQWGPKKDTPGGYALKHDCGLRVELTRIGGLKDGDRVVGARTRFRIAKNKVGGFPYATGEFDLMYGEGPAKEAEMIELGAKFGIIEKDGSIYSYQGERLGHGKENARQFLKGAPVIAGAIEVALREALEKSVASEVALGADNSEAGGEGGEEDGEEGQESKGLKVEG